LDKRDTITCPYKSLL